ncbi:MAG TPA: hypothetical protein VL988_01185 [Solirubrobacteraceae bacterium]|nr:hypothetical protein [Solirubrobacteraceae bacterium]
MRTEGSARRRRLPRRLYSLLAASVALIAVGYGSAAGTASADTPAHTDVLFLFDTSGSMTNELNEAKEKIAGVMESVSGHLPDVAFGVAFVEDVPGYENGTFTFSESEQEYAADREKAWALTQPITTDREKVTAAINALTIDYGGDGPEAYGRALWESDTNPTVGWRAGARHEIVLIADNVPHDPNLNEGLPESAWAENPFDTHEEPGGNFGIAGTTWTPGTNLQIRNVAAQLAADGKPLESIEYFGGKNYLPYWEFWAALSGGQALDGGSGELAATLVNIIETGATKALAGCPAGQVRVGEEACIVPPKPTSHPTVTQVICNLVIATASDTCTATIGDAAPSDSTNPTGTVTFASANGGLFSSGNMCSLKPTLPGNTSSCSVQFLPPAKDSTFPAITATYSGDATHNSSVGQTHYGPASSLAEHVDLSEAGTVGPGGEVEIPIECGFPCEALGELFSGPDFASISSFAPPGATEVLAEAAATHGKKHGKKKKKKPVLLGKGKLKLSKPGKGKLILKPTAKGKHALGHLSKGKSVHLTLSFTIRTLNGTVVTTKKQHVTLRPKAKKKGHKKKRH